MFNIVDLMSVFIKGHPKKGLAVENINMVTLDILPINLAKMELIFGWMGCISTQPRPGIMGTSKPLLCVKRVSLLIFFRSTLLKLSVHLDGQDV